MKLFTSNGDNLSQINEKQFNLEKDIQSIHYQIYLKSQIYSDVR